MVKVGDITDKAEEPHKVIACICGPYLLLTGLFSIVIVDQLLPQDVRSPRDLWRKRMK